jgi:hypothetical protein
MPFLPTALLSSALDVPWREPSSWDLTTPGWSASKSPAQVVFVDDRPHYIPNEPTLAPIKAYPRLKVVKLSST